jgi:hypothetical protein
MLSVNSFVYFKMMKQQNLTKQETHPRKNKIFQMRLTEDEFTLLQQVESELSISCSEYIRKRIFSNTKTVLINAKSLLAELNAAGSALGDTRNYFYHLLNQKESPKTIRMDTAEFGSQFRQYIYVQQQLEVSMRKIIRLLGN